MPRHPHEPVTPTLPFPPMPPAPPCGCMPPRMRPEPFSPGGLPAPHGFDFGRWAREKISWLLSLVPSEADADNQLADREWVAGQAVGGKADKVAGAAEGNLAALTQDGNLADSGVKPSDFADAANTYTKEQTDEAIDRVAAYYITRNAAGDAFETKSQLDSTTVFYSGGEVRTPTRNDYCVVLADETHQGAEYRYIYAVADGQTTGSWQPQFPVEGVMTVDQAVQKDSPNPVSGGGVWSAIWGTASTAFTSLYDWCVSQLAGKEDIFTPAQILPTRVILSASAQVKVGTTIYYAEFPTTRMLADKQNALSQTQLANIAAVSDALAFDATHSYAAGDPVVYNGTLYTFTAAHTGAWTGSDVSAVDIIARLASKANDNAVVKLTGDQSISGVKSFYSGINIENGSDIDFEAGGRVIIRIASGAMAILNHNGIDYSTDGGLNYVHFDWPSASGTLALEGSIPYDLGTPTVIDTADVEPIDGIPVWFGAATLADRVENIVQVTAATALDELRITFPAATSGKVRDFGLRVEIGTGSAALAAPALVPIAPTGETIKLENADGTIPALADGTATAKGVTLLYFCETAPGVFVVKGEQVEEVA